MADEFRFPDLGTNLVEGEVVQWLVQVGDRVEVDQPLVEIETEKSITEIPSPFAGIVLHHGAAEGDRIVVGDLLVVIGDDGEVWTAPEAPITRPSEPDAPVAIESTPVDAAPADHVRATPTVRKMASSHGIDLTEVTGTGPGGKIVRSDVEAFLAPRARADDGATSPAAVAGPASGDERRRMSGLRRTMAQRVLGSWREIPHFHTHDRLNATRLLEVKLALGKRLSKPVPLEALAIKALVPALREFPEFNASVDGEELVLWQRCSIGIAVDTEEGLIVAVVHDADRLGIEELSERVVELSARARVRRLAPEELTGGTFTLSNVGALSEGGSTFGTPIIPLGTTAILSLGRAERQPCVSGDELVIAPMMPLDLGCDHRAIDGGLNRRFIGRLKEYLGEPEAVLSA